MNLGRAGTVAHQPTRRTRIGLCWLASVLFGLPTLLAGPANVRVGPPPPPGEQSKDYAVTVEGKTAPVYLTRVAPADPARRWKAMDDIANSASYFDLASFSSFDMNAPVHVTVACPTAIQSAKILPSSSGIEPVITGRQLTFTLDRPRLLTVEVNGQWVSALHLFANPFEADLPNPHDPGVLYYGPACMTCPTA